jgi:maleylacetate reductase
VSAPFSYVSPRQSVRFAFGAAARAVAEEVAKLGGQRVMLIAGRSELAMAERIAAALPVVVTFTDVAMHVPVEHADRARQAAQKARADLVVSIGGGSTTGLAKAVALTTLLPIVAVPTTYAGSEATSVWGLTEGDVKTTGVADAVLPAAIVYDAELSLTLPRALSVASGLNAVAHCVDSTWAPRANPITSMYAEEGIRVMAQSLRLVVADETDREGRELALIGTYLSAVAFSAAGSGLHHKICHVLGGKYNLPHAATHAVILPYVLAFNASSAPQAEVRIGRALGLSGAVEGLLALKEATGAPTGLAEVGFDPANLDEAASAILPSVPPTNPRPVGLHDLRLILEAAYEGKVPR